MVEVIFDVLADNLAAVKAETLTDTLVIVISEALVDTNRSQG